MTKRKSDAPEGEVVVERGGDSPLAGLLAYVESGRCVVCGREPQVMTYRGTSVCSGNCAKIQQSV